MLDLRIVKIDARESLRQRPEGNWDAGELAVHCFGSRWGWSVKGYSQSDEIVSAELTAAYRFDLSKDYKIRQALLNAVVTCV